MKATLKPFDFHGVEFETPDDPDTLEQKGICPFCQHEKPRFFVNTETGLWDCKHCNRSGNIPTFLSQLHELCLEETINDFYDELSDERPGISGITFRDAGFAWHESISDSASGWLIPIRGPRGSLTTLKRYTYGGHPIATAGTNLGLFRLDHLLGNGPVILCEGEWDALALEEMRKRAGAEGSILSAPGATVFKKEWAQFFAGRDVYLMYDNDGPGEQGMDKVSKTLQRTAAAVHRIKWPSSLPEKYDVREYCIEHHVSPINAYNDLFAICEHVGGSGKSLAPVRTNPHKGTPCETFTELVNHFAEYYHFDTSMRQALHLMCATVLSTQLYGDPIWLFIVSPPGSGKTLLLKSFQESPFAVFRSSITPKSLISGYPGEGEDDPSLIPKLRGRTLVIKDYTELMTLSRQDQDEIYGILRGAYDGQCEKTFGNGIERIYPDCFFGMLAGVTDEIHRDNRASLGERFLKFQMIEAANYDPSHHILAAIDSMEEQNEHEEYLRAVVDTFTDREIDKNTLPRLTQETKLRIVSIAQVVAYCRATVPRDHHGDPAYRFGPEVGSRLAKQLVKLLQCVALVRDFQTTQILPADFELIEKVALDTARGWTLDILRTLVTDSSHSYDATTLAALAHVPYGTTKRRLNDLALLGVVETTRNKKVTPGRPSVTYTASGTFCQLWRTAFPPFSSRKTAPKKKAKPSKRTSRKR